MAFAPLSDLLVVGGLLMLARCALALGGMDSGGATGGIGASRTASYAVCAEPALILVVLTLALLAGGTNLNGVILLVREGTPGLRVSVALAFIATLTIALADTGRLPVGDPASVQPPAMLHGAMMQDYSGRHLALLEYAAALRLLLWLTLAGSVFVPVFMAGPGSGGLHWIVGLLAWAVKTLLLAVALACLETGIARMRAAQVPEFLGVAVLLGVLAALFLFVSEGFV
jgi:formate hydrogenlyase subunit 4